MSSGAEARMFADILRRLDDLESRGAITYDTGAYTPTYEGGTTPGVTTYAFQAGAYTRLGDVVVAKAQTNWSAATGTGEARFSLPFAPAAGNGSGSVYMIGVTFANSTPIVLLGAGAYFTLTSPLTNAVGTVVQMEAAGTIVYTIVYMV